MTALELVQGGKGGGLPVFKLNLSRFGNCPGADRNPGDLCDGVFQEALQFTASPVYIGKSRR